MTVNADLIAEANDWIENVLQQEGVIDLVRRLADALEVATVDADVTFERMPSSVRTLTVPLARVVSTVAELDALPYETVFRTKDGIPWEVMDISEDEFDYRFESVHMKGRFNPQTFEGDLPATVLYAPSVVTGKTEDAK